VAAGDDPLRRHVRGIQVYEYTHLIHHGFSRAASARAASCGAAAANPVVYGAATAGLYGSTFFTMTGSTVPRDLRRRLDDLRVHPGAAGKYSQQDHRGIEVIGLYWHFVDLVWIILFTIVYLI